MRGAHESPASPAPGEPHASLAQKAGVNAMQPHPAPEDPGTFPHGGTEEQVREFFVDPEDRGADVLTDAPSLGTSS